MSVVFRSTANEHDEFMSYAWPHPPYATSPDGAAQEDAVLCDTVFPCTLVERSLRIPRRGDQWRHNAPPAPWKLSNLRELPGSPRTPIF